MNVCYLGPLKDYSGYGEATRHFVAALDEAGVNVIPELVSYSRESSDFGSLGSRIEPLFAREGDYDIKVLHTTPNVFKKHMEDGKYHIAHFFWETNKVPQQFADGLQLCDEIWTGSKANEEAIRNAGVDRPIYVFPQAIECERADAEPFIVADLPADCTIFYSIFEWTDRKNPRGLIESFWEAFQNDENVALVIKTYFNGFSLINKRLIRNQIEGFKRHSGLAKFPPVFLYLDLMDRAEIDRLHETGHVYVSAHRGEGWGVPQVEAALHGNPMIATAYGGCHEYFDDTNARLIPYELVKLKGMDHSANWYTSDQKWAAPDLDAFKAALRELYEKPELRAALGAKARENVLKSFNFGTVGAALAARLKQIQEEL